MRGDRFTVALPKGRTLEACGLLFRKVGLDPAALLKGGRRLTADLEDRGVRFLLLRANDVPVYVEQGAADAGVAGAELLREHARDVYEPVDLKFGVCRLVVAAPRETRPAFRAWIEGRAEAGGAPGHPRVATKFPRLAAAFFEERGLPIEIVDLYGSIELAARTGLADLIVDLVSTGETLRANDLEEVTEILRSTSRFIVNRASYRLKHERVAPLVKALRRATA